MVLAFLALLAVLAVQQYTIHVLVNKVMSRNFYDYQTATTVPLDKKIKLKVDDLNSAEDMRIMQEFSRV